MEPKGVNRRAGANVRDEVRVKLAAAVGCVNVGAYATALLTIDEARALVVREMETEDGGEEHGNRNRE